jgi:hypothetical protein
VKLDILFPVLDKFFWYYVKQEELEAKNVNNVNK